MAEVRTLVALGANRSISAAAVLVNLSQPAMSQHLRELEEKLGVRLFDRSRRGLHPTQYGKVLIRCARAMKANMEVAAHELVALSKAESPRLRIGFQTTASVALLAPAVVELAKRAPQCTALLFEESRDGLIEQLRGGHLDVFVGRLPDAAGVAGLRYQLLAHEPVVVVCARDHPLTGKPRLVLQDLAKESWVLPGPGTGFYHQVADTFRLSNMAVPRPTVEARSMIAITAIVSTSRLVGFLPSSLCQTFSGSGLATLPVDFECRLESLGALYREEADNSPYLPYFLRALHAVAQRDTPPLAGQRRRASAGSLLPG
ncbi:LysR family transcriptional regulator [Pigmentiphaga soli]